MTTLGIAGVGLIGASIGLRATGLGYDVLAWDPNREHLATALEIGAIAAVAASFADLARDVDVVVLAAPLDATLELLAALAADPPRAELIIDVASVKAPVAAAGANVPSFCATHPIAGSERSGPAAARADLFAGRTWTYDANADATIVARVRAFLAAMGAQPVAIASAEHDRIVAATSHLPQLVSVVLGARLARDIDDPAVVALCGTGVRSMLRLGASSWPVWRAILSANRVPIAQEVRTFAAVLLAVAGGLERGESDEFARDFAASADAVARLGANGSHPGVV